MAAATIAPASRPSIAAAATARRGGSIRIALKDASPTDSLDPATWPAGFTQTAFNGSVYNNLTELAADGSVVPDLAETFEPADKASKWIFRLRHGLTFHNGREVRPADVVESIHYHLAPSSASGARPLLKDIERIEIDGANTVTFTLRTANVDFPYLMADYHLSIMPSLPRGGIDWHSGIGTGAFSLHHFEPGVSARLMRNTHYHKSGKPYFDEVEFLGIADDAARSNALNTGEIDYMNDCDPKTLALIARTPGLVVNRVPSGRHWTFDMNTGKPPFDNVHVRTALKLALDRAEIVRKVYLDEERIADDNPIVPSMQYWRETPPRHLYDPALAREHLRKAGLTTLTVDLSVSEAGFPGAVAAAELYREQAARAGIEIRIIREADDGYWENVWLRKAFSACDWYGRPTCGMQFSTVYASDAPWNNTHWKNARFDQLMHAAEGEDDEIERAAQYGQMQQILHDEGGVIVVAFASYISAHSSRLAHGSVGCQLPNDNLRMAERWWLA
jgi:peptide/nickel transport system substrate-binding protein